MALYSNLSVYKTTYEFIVYLFKSCSKVNREYKYTLLQDIRKESTELIKNIFNANKSNEKSAYIDLARENTEIIRLYVRLLRDLDKISMEKFIVMNEKIESISKQLAGWRKSCS